MSVTDYQESEDKWAAKMTNRIKALALALTFTMVAAVSAIAALPPKAYQDARANAAYHVQVAVGEVVVPETTPGQCTVTGKVVQIFRDTPGGLENGSDVSFEVSCRREGERAPLGGTLWQSVPALEAAQFMEVYLNGSPGALTVASWQVKIIDASSDEPQFP